jgi:hypothetical protein
LVMSPDKVEVGKKAVGIVGMSLDRVVVLSSEPTWWVKSLSGGKSAD